MTLIINSVLPKGRPFSANSGTKPAILPKGRSSIANSGTYVAVLLGINSCDSFPLLFAPHSLSLSLASEQTLKDPRSTNEEVRSPINLLGEIRLLNRVDLANWALRTYRNSPQGLNISSIRVFDQIRNPEIPINLRPLLLYTY